MERKKLSSSKTGKYESESAFNFITHEIDKAVCETMRDMTRLGFLTEGTGRIRINERIYDAKPGFVAILRDGDNIDIIPDAIMDFKHIEFTDMYVTETMLAKIPQNESVAFRMVEEDIKHFSDMFSILTRSYEMSDENRSDYQAGLLKALIAWFLEVRYRSDHSCTIDERYSSEMKRRQTRGEKRINVIRSAVIYVNQHFTERLIMSEVARMYDTQDQYFCRKFHEITGMSFTEYVRKLRLEYAAELVRQTSHPIKEIYLRCGYTTKSHFMREFKKHYSISPLNMRKTYIREKTEQGQ